MRSNVVDPLQIMMNLAAKANEIARQRGIRSNELDDWRACLDEAWSQIKHHPYKTRQELAEACNDRELNRRRRR
jgi:hypothetical protein